MICVTVARKPLVGSVALNVIKHGVGGIAVDACRITAVSLPTACIGTGWASQNRKNLEHGYRPNDYYADQDGTAYTPSSLGRWPANLVLCHLVGCSQEGTKTVASTIATGLTQTKARSWKNASIAGINRTGYANEDGTETVPSWTCQDGCPVTAIDSQSGVLTSGSGAVKKLSAKNNAGNTGMAYGVENRPVGSEMISYGDSGGASRFFKQIQVQKDKTNGKL